MTVAAPAPLSREEVARYSRHLIMPEVGMDGQLKLKAASVLCIGAGGLGSPVAMYLAAAGVGRLGIVDFDVVDYSNLQRQVIHGTPDVGRPKLESARDTLHAINPEVHIETHEVALSSSNALEVLGGYDVIVDGTDNFRPAISSTTRACSSASRTPTAASSASRGRPRSSPPRTGPATAASTRSRRRPVSCRAAPRAACSGFCPAWSAPSRRPRRSSWSWAWASRSSGASWSTTRSACASAS